MLNKSGEMEVFVQVVEKGGFSQASRYLDMTQPAVSKLISRMEKRLGVRLLVRTTRHLELTHEGRLFYQRATRILSEINDIERTVQQDDEPSGNIKISTSSSYSEHVLEPLLTLFLEKNSKISLDLALSDHVVDLVNDHTDIAIRSGPLKSSSLIAKALGKSPILIVASPRYLEKYGEPKRLSDLRNHRFIDFSYKRPTYGWPKADELGSALFETEKQIPANDGASIRRLALNGVGLARVPEFTVRQDIGEGTLIPILLDQLPKETEPFYAVYIGLGGPAPARVRAFLDYLSEYGRVSDN